MVQVDESTGESVPVHGGKDTSPAELESILDIQIVVVLSIKHTVGKGLTGSNTEQVTGESCAIRVDVVKGRSFLRGHLLRSTVSYCQKQKRNGMVLTPANIVPILRP